jgi:hypothetical protein
LVRLLPFAYCAMGRRAYHGAQGVSARQNYRRAGSNEAHAWLGRLAFPAAAGLAIFTGCAFLATMMIALEFDFHPALGKPMVMLEGVKLYWPFDFLKWKDQLERPGSNDFGAAGVIVFMGLVFGAALAVRLLRDGGGAKSGKVEAVGNGGFAAPREIKAAGLIHDGFGMVRGRMRPFFTDQLLVYRGAGHVLCFDGTRTGNGRGIVIPTWMWWPGSLVVPDPKGELAEGDARPGPELDCDIRRCQRQGKPECALRSRPQAPSGARKWASRPDRSARESEMKKNPAIVIAAMNRGRSMVCARCAASGLLLSPPFREMNDLVWRPLPRHSPFAGCAGLSRRPSAWRQRGHSPQPEMYGVARRFHRWVRILVARVAAHCCGPPLRPSLRPSLRLASGGVLRHDDIRLRTIQCDCAFGD